MRLSYGLISETGRHIVFSSCIVLMWPCSDVSRADSICIAYSPTLHNLIIYAVPLTSEGKFEIVAHILNTENSISNKLAEKIIQMHMVKIQQNRLKCIGENGWQCISNDVKLKKNKKIISDIDMVASRNDTILIIQPKCVINSLDIYNHYKARIRIVAGIRRAKVSLENIKDTEVYSQILKHNHINKRMLKICISLSLPIRIL